MHSCGPAHLPASLYKRHHGGRAHSPSSSSTLHYPPSSTTPMAPVMAPSAHSTRSRTMSPRPLQQKLTDENVTRYDEDIAVLVARDRSRDKALLIAAQVYPGEQAELSTPHSDQNTLHEFLVKISFNSSNIHCLREDHSDALQHPTKKNIVRLLSEPPCA